MSEPDPSVEVRMLLTAAGLPASDDEVAILAQEYAATRASVDRLYDVADARYGEPALHFRPELDDSD